jgi:hypothetical protein
MSAPDPLLEMSDNPFAAKKPTAPVHHPCLVCRAPIDWSKRLCRPCAWWDARITIAEAKQ